MAETTIDWTDIAKHVADNWPDESGSAEWLGAYWCEAMSEDERAMFSGFNDFAAAVREQRG